MERIEDVFSLAKKEAWANGTFFASAGLAFNFTILALLYYGGTMVMEEVRTHHRALQRRCHVP